MEISRRGVNVRMAYQSLDSFEIVPIMQEGYGEDMPSLMGVDPLPEKSRFNGRFTLSAHHSFPSSHELHLMALR